MRYRGLAKNLARAETMFALANLYQLRNRLLPLGRGVPGEPEAQANGTNEEAGGQRRHLRASASGADPLTPHAFALIGVVPMSDRRRIVTCAELP